jgi:hypothetical protein
MRLQRLGTLRVATAKCEHPRFGLVEGSVVGDPGFEAWIQELLVAGSVVVADAVFLLGLKQFE